MEITPISFLPQDFTQKILRYLKTKGFSLFAPGFGVHGSSS
jgi:hypothetical protein